MNKKILFPAILVASAICAIPVFLSCHCSYADQKHQAKGSIEFGASKNPLGDKTKNLGPFRTLFSDIASTVIPTVVSVIPTKVDTVMYGNPFYQFFGEPFSDENPFNFFFGNPPQSRKQHRRVPGAQRREHREQGLGCGVIVSKDGYILTNYHVVFGASQIAIKLHDGRQFNGMVVGSDSMSDVAVVKIKEAVNDLPTAYLGNSDRVRPGDWALAVGNPFSLTSTVTVGIVSALNRTVEGPQRYQNFIQTDAAINPGNSGGALVDIDGEVIGINTLIYTSSGGFMGIGFAIPINMARQIMESLIYNGRVIRGWIGVSIQDITPATRDALNLGTREGVLVGDVYHGQPADRAGIRRGDIILSVKGTSVADANQLRNTVAAIEPGTRVPVVIFRSGRELRLQVTIATRNERAVENLSTRRSPEKPVPQKTSTIRQLGITIGNLTPDLQSRYGIGDSISGVVVTGIDQGFDEVASLLQPGDVLQQLKVRESDFVPVRNIDQFRKTIKGLRQGDAIMLLVWREGSSFYVSYSARK